MLSCSPDPFKLPADVANRFAPTCQIQGLPHPLSNRHVARPCDPLNFAVVRILKNHLKSLRASNKTPFSFNVSDTRSWPIARNLIQPMLPLASRRPKGGRPRLSDRACLTGILFVLRSGILWEMLPQELGCGSGMTCWRRLRDWQERGLWDLIHFVCWIGWLAVGELIGQEQSWMAATFALFLGGTDGTESH